MKYQKWMSGEKRLKVTGNRKVYVQGLKQASRTLRRVGALEGSDGGGTGLDAAKALGKYLLEAAELFRALAQSHASYSAQIPPKIKVRGGRSGVYLACRAGPAYPNEVEGVRHPVFGIAGIPWVTNQYRPFFAPAAEEGVDAAAEIVALAIDEWAAEYGFH